MASRRWLLIGAVATAIVLVTGSVHKSWAELKQNDDHERIVHHIAIKAFAFHPQQINVKVGDIIQWINHDLAPHTATGHEGRWDTKTLNQGDSKEVAVTKKMDALYYCRFHPHMTGSITLVD